jgi:Escherichia/Staphylococcus phage prohead protease
LAKLSTRGRQAVQGRRFTSGGVELRTFRSATKWQASPGKAFTIRGYAAVYNETSHDLGGFQERITPGAFDEVLATKPDVHFVWDHDTRYVLARTWSRTLDLNSDLRGLHVDAKVGDYSWAKDLRIALERGDIDQASFSFSLNDGGDEWAVDDNERVIRTIRNVSGLYDVTVTAKGAYPQTSLALARD